VASIIYGPARRDVSALPREGGGEREPAPAQKGTDAARGEGNANAEDDDHDDNGEDARCG